MNNNYIIAAIIIVTLAIIYIIFRKRNKTKEVIFHKKWALEPKLNPIRFQETNDTVSSSIIPEQVMRDMIPHMYLDKYFPESLVEQMPHKKQKKRENFDAGLTMITRDIINDNNSEYDIDIN